GSEPRLRARTERRRRNLLYSAFRARAVLVLVWLLARGAGRPPDRALPEATQRSPRPPPRAFCVSERAGQVGLVMGPGATAASPDNVVSLVHEAGGEAFVSRGESRTIIGLSGDIDRFAATLNLTGLPGVSDVVRISVPYKLVSREHRRERSVIRVAGVPIGPDTLTVIAGPCAVETPEQTLAAAKMAMAAGASLLR